uniref:Uncharacterized protein n=1 Tax=Solanum tuberosum TaxID=4113 RepID=M1DYS7_SOLTU
MGLTDCRLTDGLCLSTISWDWELSFRVRPTAMDHRPWSDLRSVGPGVGQYLANFFLWGSGARGLIHGPRPQTIAWPTDHRSGCWSTLRLFFGLVLMKGCSGEPQTTSTGRGSPYGP